MFATFDSYQKILVEKDEMVVKDIIIGFIWGCANSFWSNAVDILSCFVFLLECD